jgi:hypothetical protein
MLCMTSTPVGTAKTRRRKEAAKILFELVFALFASLRFHSRCFRQIVYTVGTRSRERIGFGSDPTERSEHHEPEDRHSENDPHRDHLGAHGLHVMDPVRDQEEVEITEEEDRNW